MNAVKHGMRAETMILGNEDPQALEHRMAVWTAKLEPRDDAEHEAVKDVVDHMWLRDRARRAQAARYKENLAEQGALAAEATEREVEDLGARLFRDRTGPLTAYPTDDELRFDMPDRDVSTSYDPRQPDDPDRPSALVIDLQRTLDGCLWMIAQWAQLKATLEEGKPWIPCEKLMAVRLLGKQPFDVITDRDVAMVFLASSVLKPDRRPWYWEIANEMNQQDWDRLESNIADRQLNSRKPANPAEAKEALLAIIERATERLTLKAELHRERAEFKEEIAAEKLRFDESPMGQRLRDYEQANVRGIDRALNRLYKLRRPVEAVRRQSSVVSGRTLEVRGQRSEVRGQTSDVSGQASDVSGQASDVSGQTSEVGGQTSEVSGQASVVSGENVTNEAAVEAENRTNEATALRATGSDAPSSGPPGHPPTDRDLRLLPAWGEGDRTNEAIDNCQNPANEATDDCQNLTNEANAHTENRTNEANHVSGPSSVVSRKDAPNEAMEIGEILTNEATVDAQNLTNEANLVNCPSSVVSGEAAAFEACDEARNPTNEATDLRENRTTEATDGAEQVTDESPLSDEERERLEEEIREFVRQTDKRILEEELGKEGARRWDWEKVQRLISVHSDLMRGQLPRERRKKARDGPPRRRGRHAKT
jgi:hypothetical protein